VTRRASEDGRTQAALTLVRGIAHHHGCEVQALVWRGMEVLAVEKGRLVPMKVYFVEAEGYVEAQPFTVAAAWRPLSELPPSPEKHSDTRSPSSPSPDRPTSTAPAPQQRPVTAPPRR
jgi:hypothetical protein